MRYSVETDYKLLIRNIVQHKWMMTLLFSLIALSLTAVGYFEPKMYTSTSTLIMGGETVLEPILEGAAVSTGNKTDWTQVAKEILYSRTTVAKLMRQLGYLEGDIESLDDEILLKEMKSSIEVELVGSDKYLKIGYTNESAEEAKRVATELTKIFINDIHSYHTSESEEAFQFIDGQVKSYHKKLLVAEDKLKIFKTSRLETGAGSEEAISKRLDRLQEVLDQSQLDLREAMIKKNSLERELSGEVQATVSIARQSQYLKRLQSLQDRLSELRLSYHEEYPDIQSVKYQIEDVRRQIKLEKSDPSNSIAGVEDGFKANQVYQDIKLQLSQAKTKIATLNTRISVTRDNIVGERKKGNIVHTSDAGLAELNRDYDVNKKLYEDLLTRREAARVSKEIDEQQKGLNLKIYEPAFLPRLPSGLQFYHFVLAGLIFGILLPVALMYFRQLVDSTVRAPEAIMSKLKVPVLGMVPEFVSDKQLRDFKSGDRMRQFVILLTFAGIALISVLKMLQETS